MNFNGKVVIITGSSRGIGKAIAELFVLSGANVVINNSNNYEQLIDTKHYLDNMALTPVTAISADVSDYNKVKQMVDTVINRFGSIDILINNAGISHIGLFSDMNPSQWVTKLLQ